MQAYLQINNHENELRLAYEFIILCLNTIIFSRKSLSDFYLHAQILQLIG
ncbi:hypothetical protein DAI22_09g062500 [Oryza sativa Japonica Group]|nr:hypothetical protein DAI22_09g062500 [Oryza sativa Japonica Group]